MKYEITYCDVGKTEHMTVQEAIDMFGKDELAEYIQGYHPGLVIMEVEDDRELPE